MTPMIEGFYISLLGMMITFLALGIFILIMVVLKKLFPQQNEEVSAQQVDETPALVVETADMSAEGAVIAAIAAAIVCTRFSGRGGLGDTLNQPRGRWWAARRTEASLGDVKRR
jgi:sodium pump decarboxylase gamma subunit